MGTLEDLRKSIDEIDDNIVCLLNKRAELVLAVKAAKEKDKMDIYSPARERQILDRVSKLIESGHFPKQSVERIFSNIISATRSLIGELTVGFVGTDNSLSRQAASKQFGESVHFIPEKNVLDLVRKVESGESNFGVVATRVAGGGLVGPTYELLMDSKVFIIAEVELSGQSGDNETRYAILGTKIPSATGRDKTSIACAVQDKAGALRDLLQPFSDQGITLLRIESRPLTNRSWEYVFFIDISGHQTSPEVGLALKELEKVCSFVRVLGSYPLVYQS